MALYALAFDSDNIELGPCYVYWEGVHVGHTYGGVTVSITQNVYELKSDQYGEIPLKVKDAGIRIEVTVNMTENVFSNVKILFSTYLDKTDHLEFGRPVGGDIVTGELVLEPTDGSEVYQIYKAAPNIGEAVEIAFTADTQRVFSCKFVGLIDDTRAVGDQLFRLGGFSS